MMPERKTILKLTLITPLLVALLLPTVMSRQTLLPVHFADPEWYTLAEKDDIDLRKITSVELEMGYLRPEELFKFGEDYYTIAVRDTFMRPYFTVAYLITLVLLLIGTVITYLLLVRFVERSRQSVDRGE